ncbi:protein hit [Abditibacteriota bacterium]|nr:protein hit [Abditibacteriota bacterium]
MLSLFARKKTQWKFVPQTISLVLNSTVYNNEPENYRCPFCCIVEGVEGEFPLTKQADVIYRDEVITAFIASHWRPDNKGHVIVIPNAHIENLYDMPDDLLAAVHSYARRVARALKIAYGCEGVSVRQNNEGAGDQDVWHYHVHVVPRFEGDNMYQSYQKIFLSDPAERIVMAEKVRAALS